MDRGLLTLLVFVIAMLLVFLFDLYMSHVAEYDLFFDQIFMTVENVIF